MGKRIKQTSYLVGAVGTHALVVHVSDLLLLAGGEREGVAGWQR